MILALLGDVMLGRGVAAHIGSRPPGTFWGDVLPVLRGADLVAANLECAITTHARPWTRTPKVFHFRAPPAAVDVLRAAGVRLVSVANNHILDYEERGLLDTLRHLDAAGIAAAGAGEDAAAAAAPALVEAGGLRVAMIAATDNEPGWRAGPDRPGTQYVRIGGARYGSIEGQVGGQVAEAGGGDAETDGAALDRVESGVRAARSRGAELVILSLHWGPNMVLRPPPAFRRFARGALDRGVDLVHGHSAHVVQGIELHRGRPILYDTGDFLDDYAVDPGLRNDLSFVFLADADADGVRELRLVPVRLGYAEVNRARAEDAERITRRTRRLCEELGTAAERDGAGLRIAVRTAGPPVG